MQLFDPIDYEVFRKSRFTSQASRWGLHPGLCLADEWDMTDENRAIAMKQWRDTMRPKLIVT